MGGPETPGPVRASSSATLRENDRRLERAIDRLSDKIDQVIQVELRAIDGAIRELRTLIDGIHRELHDGDETRKAHEARIAELERWRAEERGRGKARALQAVGGGGAAAGVIEAIRHLLGGL